MKREFETIVKSYNDRELNDKVDHLFEKMKDNELNFSDKISGLKIKQGKKVRRVLEIERKSLEEISLKYLKTKLDINFNIDYPNRKKIMNQCFSTIETITKFSDFVIYKFDFKDFFESVSSLEVFNKYIRYSSLYRYEKDILETLFTKYCKCYAGLPTSNVLIELISREYDRILQSKLCDRGLLFYSRYVDDVLLIFNQYISQNELKSIVQDTIKEIFTDSDLNINEQKETYICKSNHKSKCFTYLGYEFKYISNNKKFYFEYGIDIEKIKKYKKKFAAIIQDYKTDNNTELFRQRLLFLSSRVVFYNNSKNDYKRNVNWDAIGIIENYREISNFIQDKEKKISRRTKFFLNKEIIVMIQQELPSLPYFLKKRNHSYLLENRMRKKKSIIFHPNIGWTKEHLIIQIKKIDPSFITHKLSYRKLVTQYCKLLKIKKS
ncbi:hypothetical protein [Priestia aryabhattai]|uniref:hypothetical protein n=1 Tax=Priestia aryabhattai TaxID=412384 RepID=UPI003D297481